MFEHEYQAADVISWLWIDFFSIESHLKRFSYYVYVGRLTVTRHSEQSIYRSVR